AIRFVQIAAADGAGVRVMVPMTVSPRYVPENISKELKSEIDRVTPPYADAVPYGVTLDLDVEMPVPIRIVDSPSHPLRVELDGCRGRISFGRETTAPDRDLIVSIGLSETRSLSGFIAEYKGHDHVVVECLPDANQPTGDRRKTVVFLIDCSGSMGGDSITQARRAVELCLRALRPGDAFQIVRFGSTCKPLMPRPVTFDQDSLDAAVKQIRGIDADLGGTEILKALERVEEMVSEARYELLVLTDGQVSNEEAVLNWATKQRSRCRVFSFGIGAGASEYLVKGMARCGGGSAEFIFPGERIEPKVLRQFTRIGSPVVTDLSIDWGLAGADPAPGEIRSAFGGESLLVGARFPAGHRIADGHRVEVRGKTASGEVRWTAVLRRAGGGGLGDGAALWWAREALRDLEEPKRSGGQGSNQKRDSASSRKREAITLSIEYGLLCSGTSFLAVERRSAEDKTTERAVLRRVPVQITTGWHGRPGLQFGLTGIMAACAPLASAVIGAGGVPGTLCERMALFSCDSSPSGRSAPTRKRSVAKDPGSPGFLAHPPHADESGAIDAYDILIMQLAEGWFELDPVLTDWCGHSRDELLSWARELTVPGGIDAGKVIATLLAMHLLQTRAATEEDIWRAGVLKATELIERHKIDAPGGVSPLKWLESKLGG
ncbi:MAG TPA: VWA domain-containing protein, partial [Candidatus Ozemobacteraceae bacterium]|nr:VWA domain-containing protein [Candidatus Ozemobacteraceae bacterium]